MPLFGKKRDAQPTPQPKNSPRVERLVWLGLKVADQMGESLFLEETLQLPFREEGSSGAVHHIRYDCGRVELELVDGGQTWISRPRPKNGSPDIPVVASFTVDNIEQVVEQLSAKEVPLTQVFDQDWAASSLFFDPERNVWQIEELRTLPPIGSPKLHQIGTVWLECQDFEQQLAFYRDILQMPLVAQGGGLRPVTRHTEEQRRYPQTEPLTANTELTQNVSQAAPDETLTPVAAESDATAQKVEVEQLTDAYMPPPTELGLNPLPLDTPDEIEASLTGQNPRAAIFFDEPTHLGLVPGGRKPPNVQQRVWGRDVNLTLGFQTFDINGLAERLRQAGYSLTAPAPNPDARRGLAFNFSDPEGNVWQVAEWPHLKS